MTRTVELTAVIERDGDVYVATCPQLDIASHGDSPEHARAMLIEAVEAWLEVASPEEIAESLPSEIRVESITIESAKLAIG
jgi:predicted RNase H-like HicB family nuclease